MSFYFFYFYLMPSICEKDQPILIRIKGKTAALHFSSSSFFCSIHSALPLTLISMRWYLYALNVCSHRLVFYLDYQLLTLNAIAFFFSFLFFPRSVLIFFFFHFPFTHSLGSAYIIVVRKPWHTCLNIHLADAEDILFANKPET